MAAGFSIEMKNNLNLFEEIHIEDSYKSLWVKIFDKLFLFL